VIPFSRPALLGNLPILAVLGMSSSHAGETMPPQVYEITTETGMPHLEENLRYTTQHEKRCLTHQTLATAFPILGHPALKGCTLQNETRQEDAIYYTLVCDAGHGTTGQAIWHVEDHRIRGTLNIKLGGKNMTFYQRITAVPSGRCTALE
jgi:Protein of unknown function (DUF3617)